MEKLVFLIKTLPLPQFPQKNHLHWAQLKSLDFFFPVDASQISTPFMKELLPDKALVTKIPRKSQIPGIFSMENWNIFLSRKAGFAGTTWDKWEVLLSTHPKPSWNSFTKKSFKPGMSGCCKSWNSQGISSLEFPSFIPKKLTRSVCSWAAWLEKSLGDCWHSWQTWEIWEKKEQNSQFLTFWCFFYALNPAPCTPRGCRDWLQSWIKRRLEGDEKGFPHIPATFQLVWNGFLHPLEFTATDPSWNAPDFPGKNLPKSGIGVGFRRQIHPHSQQGLDDPVPGWIPRILKLLENLEKEKIQFLLEQKEEKQEC